MKEKREREKEKKKKNRTCHFATSENGNYQKSRIKISLDDEPHFWERESREKKKIGIIKSYTLSNEI